MLSLNTHHRLYSKSISLQSSLICLFFLCDFAQSQPTYNVSCNSAYECSNVQCPDNMDCIVHCDGTNSCRNADIVCPIQGSCRVSSTGQTALYSATVDARAMVSGQLDIFASGWNSLSHAEIYCPQPSGDAQCLINVDGNDPDVLIGTRIHAVHGFNDIQTNCKNNSQRFVDPDFWALFGRIYGKIPN
eukprot:58663_1